MYVQESLSGFATLLLDVSHSGVWNKYLQEVGGGELGHGTWGR